MRFLIFFILVFLLILPACDTEEKELVERNYPILDTREEIQVSESGARVSAMVHSLGNSTVRNHGFMYGLAVAISPENSNIVSLGPSVSTGVYEATLNRGLVEGRTYHFRAFIETEDKLILGQVLSFVSQGNSEIELVDYFPKEAVVGDTITVAGGGFSNAPGDSRVMIGGVQTNLVSLSPDTLKGIIPLNVETGEQVVSVRSAMQSAEFSEKFQLLEVSVQSIYPTSVLYGDTAEIYATNLPDDIEYSKIEVFRKPATILSNSKNSLKFIIPETADTSRSRLKITVGNQVKESSSIMELRLPTVSGFAPKEGTANTRISIEGSKFNLSAEHNHISLNNKELAIVSVARDEIVAEVPSGISPGSYPLVIKNPAETIETSEQFTIVTPQIESIFPLEAAWGEQVVIFGKHFGDSPAGNRVVIEGIEATIVEATSARIVFVVPSDVRYRTNRVAVHAIETDNQSVQAVDRLLLKQPVITSFTPDHGSQNSEITIYGANLNPEKENYEVTIGFNMTTEVTEASSGMIRFTITSPVAESTYPIRVRVNGNYVTTNDEFHLRGPWKNVNTYPRYSSYSGAYVYDGQVYLGGGENSELYYNFDPVTASWTYFKEFGRYPGGIDWMIGDRLYYGSGKKPYTDELNSPVIHYYDFSDNTQGDLSVDLPGRAFGLSVTANGKGYTGLGFSTATTALNDFYSFDPSTGDVTRLADFPGVPRGKAAEFVIDKYIYILGGSRQMSNYNTSVSDLWRYSIETNDWMPLSQFPGRLRSELQAVVIDNVVYVFGGYNNKVGSTFNDMWRYDPDTDSWDQISGFPGQTPSQGAGSFYLNGKAYLINGRELWEYDPER